MSLYNAVDNFEKLVKTLGGENVAHVAAPEKGLLYLGLLNLARGLRHLETEVESLKRELSQVDSHVKRIPR